MKMIQKKVDMEKKTIVKVKDVLKLKKKKKTIMNKLHQEKLHQDKLHGCIV